MEGDTLLTMEGINKSFGIVKAVKNGYLELKKGEVHALMGENGAGKSTLMNILSGAFKADTGKIVYMGKEVTISSPIEARALGIGKVHQELQLVPGLTVGENIFMGSQPRTKLGFVDYKKMFTKAEGLLESFGLTVSPKVKVNELRVGEQQLVEIVKTISLDCKVVIMDEPTSALSKQEAERLFEIIALMKKDGVSVVYITHRMEEVFEISDRITVMRDGEFIATVDTEDTTRNDLITMMVGREIGSSIRAESTIEEEEILRVEDLTLNFPQYYKKTSLKNISFSLKKGEILGIAGLMGAGRTELLESLFGLHTRMMTGQIYIHGKPVHIRRPEDAIKHRVVFMTEDRKKQGLVLSRSIGENMSLPILKALSKWFFMNTKIERPLWAKQMAEMKIKAPSAGTLAGDLSGGNQQKVVIGRWLLTDPEILLLDEPTRGIDVGSRGEIYQLISNLADLGKGVIVVSSELPELLNFCDRIITFCEGRLTGEFLRHEADQEVLLRAATLREEWKEVC